MLSTNSAHIISCFYRFRRKEKQMKKQTYNWTVLFLWAFISVGSFTAYLLHGNLPMFFNGITGLLGASVSIIVIKMENKNG